MHFSEINLKQQKQTNLNFLFYFEILFLLSFCNYNGIAEAKSYINETIR
jgi:hypothetical protein